MRRNKNNIILVMVIFVGVIIILPFIINVAYKQNIPIDIFQTEWDASAALTYYGALAAAGIAGYGVYVTIRSSRKNYEEDVRYRTLPYIAINILRPEGRRSTHETQVDNYHEYKLSDYYFIINKGEIQVETELTDRQREILESGGEWVDAGGVEVFRSVPNLRILIEIENVGNGAATNFRIEMGAAEVLEAKRKYVFPLSLKTGNKIIIMMIHMYSYDCDKDDNSLGQYMLGLYYEDIYENRYRQELNIAINDDDENGKRIFSIDPKTRQEFLGGKNE